MSLRMRMMITVVGEEGAGEVGTGEVGVGEAGGVAVEEVDALSHRGPQTQATVATMTLTMMKVTAYILAQLRI